jgi:hypothetical protein
MSHYFYLQSLDLLRFNCIEVCSIQNKRFFIFLLKISKEDDKKVSGDEYEN